MPIAMQHKDYDIGARTWNDEQAAHPSGLAGSIYARGIKEAPGHIESRRAEYRQISREWHSWLGFALYLRDRARAYRAGLGPKGGSGSLDLSLKRKALSNIPQNRVAKRGQSLEGLVY